MEEVRGSDNGDKDIDVEARKERTVLRGVRTVEGTGLKAEEVTEWKKSGKAIMAKRILEWW